MHNIEVPCDGSIKRLIKFLDDRNKKYSINEYRIIEWFSDSEPVVYILNNLQLEYEQETLFRPAFLVDSEKDDTYIMKHIDTLFAPHIEMITFHTIMDAITITLIAETYSGYIRIHY